MPSRLLLGRKDPYPLGTRMANLSGDSTASIGIRDPFSSPEMAPHLLNQSPTSAYGTYAAPWHVWEPQTEATWRHIEQRRRLSCSVPCTPSPTTVRARWQHYSQFPSQFFEVRPNLGPQSQAIWSNAFLKQISVEFDT
jgi:hypothetical protein